MALPPRAKTFLDRLEEFLSTDAMQGFRKSALLSYLGEDDLPEPDTLTQVQTYAMHQHRDKKGRSLVDRFLEAHAEALSSEEEEVYTRLGESTFGFFEVEALERGKGMRLRRVGTDESFQVIETGGTREVNKGAGIFTYLAPYRDHHEMVGAALVYPKEFVYVIDRTVRHDPEAALAHLSDPLWAYKQIDKQRSTPQPPENRLEAELLAEQTLTELKLPWTVKELQPDTITVTFRGPGATLYFLKQEQIAIHPRVEMHTRPQKLAITPTDIEFPGDLILDSIIPKEITVQLVRTPKASEDQKKE